jgi:hypothetical protein
MMLNETTENFLRVMAEFEWPENKPIAYRLYYNDDGSPECYTMDDLPGKYIEVDRETYINHTWNVRVEDEKLRIIPITKTVKKLGPSLEDGVACHPSDICVVTNTNQHHTKWNMTTYEVN